MSGQPISDSELAQLLVRVASVVRAPGKPIPMHICRFLIADIPALVGEVRMAREQLAARDAQIARMRLVIEGAAVGT